MTKFTRHEKHRVIRNVVARKIRLSVVIEGFFSKLHCWVLHKESNSKRSTNCSLWPRNVIIICTIAMHQNYAPLSLLLSYSGWSTAVWETSQNSIFYPTETILSFSWALIKHVHIVKMFCKQLVIGHRVQYRLTILVMHGDRISHWCCCSWSLNFPL